MATTAPALKALAPKLRGLPRKVRRKIWHGAWKHRRREFTGANRRERREDHRKAWSMFRQPVYGYRPLPVPPRVMEQVKYDRD